MCIRDRTSSELGHLLLEPMRDITCLLYTSVFSTLMDAFLLFYDQQSNPDTVLPAEDVISENRFKSNGNTIRYSNVQVKTSESVGAPEIKLSKKIYGYKKLRDNDRSGLSDSCLLYTSRCV